MKPLLLRPDNFTPPTRTPWGGRKILERYKVGLGLDARDPVVGESWEVSVEPDFPSLLREEDATLADRISAAPVDWLGQEIASRFGGQTPLLVKLLDSADNLSVQVHPADGDPVLGPDESGKPESWVVLEAEPGAGLYLGFVQGVGRREVHRCIEEGGALDELLNFVEVSAGDVFVIEAGSPHAIGSGVTLVEPQLVAPGRRGITYRYWDWNRRYDGQGRLDPAGRPRQLHLQRSLDVTRWDSPRGEDFIAACRPDQVLLADGEATRVRLVSWRWFVVERWQGDGVVEVEATGTMWALLCVGGEARVSAGEGEIRLRCGESCVVPAAAGGLSVALERGLVFATRSQQG